MTATLGQINRDPFDRLTIIHMAIGTFYGMIRVPWWWTLGAAAVWEVIEFRMKPRAPELFAWPAQDSPINAVMDVAITMAGWSAVELARQYRRTKRAAAGLPPLDGPRRRPAALGRNRVRFRRRPRVE